MKEIPIGVIYVTLALIGGVARYLVGYVNGTGFQFRIFAAGVIVAGFSGYMFALLGTALNMPAPLLSVMAGTGGFMGDQAMKFVIEYVTTKV